MYELLYDVEQGVRYWVELGDGKGNKKDEVNNIEQPKTEEMRTHEHP